MRMSDSSGAYTFSEFSLRTDDTNFIAARVRNKFPIYSYELEVLKYCPRPAGA